MLEVEGLAKRYGDVLALQDLTVSVEEGQCLVLLGRNGAGKTTALRCMAGVLLPSGGLLQVDGIDAADDPAAVRARGSISRICRGKAARSSSAPTAWKRPSTLLETSGSCPPAARLR